MSFLARSPAPVKPPAKSAKAPALTKPQVNPEALRDYCDALGAPEGFIPYAERLGFAPQLPAPVPPEVRAQDDMVVEAVLEHFRANQLGPNSFPTQSLRILNLVANPNADMAELNRLISRDPALSAAVLKVANSAMYRGISEIETVRDAISRLGLAEVARIAGIVSARTLFNSKVKAEFASFGARWNRMFHQAVTTAMGGAWLALQKDGAKSDHVFLTGMLHDVGKSIGLRSIVALLFEKRMPAPFNDERCERVIERVHVEIGAAAHQSWELPSHALMACKRHHEETLAAVPELTDLHIVRLTSALVLMRAEPQWHPHAITELYDSAQALNQDPFAIRTLDTELKRIQGAIAGTLA